MRRFLAPLVLAACALNVLPLRAETGVSSAEVVLGQSAAFSGPAAQLGIDMNNGASAYFDAINAQGGVHGRRIVLKKRDDGYEADRAAKNTREFIETDNVFALFGYVGTPTSNAALPIFTQAGVPFIAPFTGANSLREPFNRNIVNLRASYDNETEKLVEHLVTTSVTKIAVFHQNDAYGNAGLAGVKRAMGKRNLPVVAIATVERNSTDVQAAMTTLMAARPDAIVQVSAYASSASLIKEMRRAGYGGQFLNVSFVGSKALADALGKDGAGVIVSQVVPFPWGASTPVQREYAQSMRVAGMTPNFGTMEGFLAAKMFVEALRRAGPAPSRDKLIAAFDTMRDHDLGGFKLNFGPNDHNGSHFVEMTIVTSDGRFIR